MTMHKHDPNTVLPGFRGRTPQEQEQAVSRLIRQLNAKTDSGHVARGPADSQRALLLLGVLEGSCRRGRTIGSQLGVDMADVDGTGSIRPIDDSGSDDPGVPHKGTYLHNLWHLLWG